MHCVWHGTCWGDAINSALKSLIVHKWQLESVIRVHVSTYSFTWQLKSRLHFTQDFVFKSQKYPFWHSNSQNSVHIAFTGNILSQGLHDTLTAYWIFKFVHVLGILPGVHVVLWKHATHSLTLSSQKYFSLQWYSADLAGTVASYFKGNSQGTVPECHVFSEIGSKFPA